MFTSRGRSIFASCETLMPMIARLGSSGAATVRTVRSTTLSSCRSRSATSSPGSSALVAGLELSRRVEQLLYGRHLAPVDADDDVTAGERLRGGDVEGDGLDEHAARHRLDGATVGPKRDGRRDLLGVLHLGARLHDAVTE